MPKLTVELAAGGWWFVQIGQGIAARADCWMYSTVQAAQRRASMIREGWI